MADDEVEISEDSALTPEGYANGAEGLLGKCHWQSGGKRLDGPTVWPVLKQPDAVAKAGRGEKVEEPKLPAKGEAGQLLENKAPKPVSQEATEARPEI